MYTNSKGRHPLEVLGQAEDRVEYLATLATFEGARSSELAVGDIGNLLVMALRTMGLKASNRKAVADAVLSHMRELQTVLLEWADEDDIGVLNGAGYHHVGKHHGGVGGTAGVHLGKATP